MIPFACPSCQAKLKVKDDLAGKQIRCPKCKESVAIPTDNAMTPERPSFAEDATVPPRPASFHEDATVPPAPSKDAVPRFKAGQNHAVDDEAPRESLKAEANYQVEGEIARGGMGAIMRAVDQDIQREVAVKFLLNQADARQKARFVEEAQITGQLEHPNIVPIHQLGVGDDGRCFFSMKMVKGRSLAQILKPSEPEASATVGGYTLGRLLTIFAGICNAMAYAHSRQVIHRDLKPANIMVGDFGEVYVMDWGLAKALGTSEPEASATERKTVAHASGSDSGSRVATTTRQTVGDLTQAGSIMGTPAYMPPEQASGADVDRRADIYALGAILYETMTLTPPVGRGGDMMAILMRVVEGKIDDPAQRAPERATKGWIPPELSAIALKALSKKREDRYPTVEALQKDIHLFQEGRSVSAKHDTFREQFVKLVKRNKGVSVALGVLLPVLIGVLLYSAISNSMERARTAKAYQDYQDQVKNSVPAFVKAARLAADQRLYDDAMTQVEVALASAPDNDEARLLKAQLLVVRQDFPAATVELQKLAATQPNAPLTRRLLNLCRDANPGDVARLVTISCVFYELQAHALVDGLLRPYGKNSNEARQFLLKMYREKIEKAWPGKGTGLTIDAAGLHLACSGYKDITDLTPLSGIPLSTLHCGQTAIGDLAPIRGMPLTALSCSQTRVKDLEPVRGMSLTSLVISQTRIEDLTPLEGMPLKVLSCSATAVTDLTPLRGMALTRLECSTNHISSLEPLAGMPLTSLDVGSCPRITDLAPLKGMPLTRLRCFLTQISDLSVLQGMPLTELDCSGTLVTDLTPLAGTPLLGLRFQVARIAKGIDLLRGMKSLKQLGWGNGGNQIAPADEFWQRYDAGEFKKK